MSIQFDSSGLFTRARRLCTVAGVLLLMWGTFAPTNRTASAQQGPDVPPEILLGEFFFRQVAAGASVQLQIDLPREGTYLFTSDVPESAGAFTFTLLDEAGQEIYHGPFAPLELSLPPARYALQFQIEPKDENDADTPTQALLSLVILEHLGSLSTSAETPGQLYAGGFVRATGVDGQRYAVLSVPPSLYPQEVLLSISPGESEAYLVTVQGDDLEPIRVDSRESTLLRFWTRGGDYALAVEPVGESAGFTLVPFLSGPPPLLPLEDVIESTLPAHTTQTLYQLALDVPYRELSVALATDEADLQMTLVDAAAAESVAESAVGAEMLDVQDLAAGTYYVVIERAAAADTDRPFAIQATGVAGPPIAVLTPATPQEDAIAGAEIAHYYEFAIEEPGARVTVTLEGPPGLELGVGSAAAANTWDAPPITTTEDLTPTQGTTHIQFVAPVAGSYLAEVSGGQAGDPFAIRFAEGDLAPMLQVGEPTWGSTTPHRRDLYRLEITEPGQFLTVMLVGAPTSELALSVTSYDEEGVLIRHLSGNGSGAHGAVSLGAAPAGLYEIGVDGGDTGGDYFVLARLEDPVTLGAQWAVEAESGALLAMRIDAVTGAPDAAMTAGTGTAIVPTSVWAPPSEGVAALELRYAHAVEPRAVHVSTVEGAAAVLAIDAYDPARGRWITLWSSTSAPMEEAASAVGYTAQFALDPANFASDRIRLRMDTARAEIAIDAVALHGLPR